MTIRAVASLLRRAWLLAATLAVIAGLLGMHVLTSGHGSNGSASPAVHSAGHAAVAPFTAGGHAGHHAAATLAVPDHAMPDPAVPAAAACGDSCPGAQESGAPCVPTAPGGPVSVSPPPASLAALPALAAVGNTPGCSYSPPCPTPCDLSISRT